MKTLCEVSGLRFCKEGAAFFVADDEAEFARCENPIVAWATYCGMAEQRGRRALGEWCQRHGRNRYTGERMGNEEKQPD